MKQIIPFKKELLFKTKVNEITSISLEHTLSLKNEDQIAGSFQITGDYKMTNSSINKEQFEFNLPFEIELDDKYNPETITIDIDNFYYEIINNEALKVNIDVYLEGTPIPKESKEEIIEIEPEVIKESPPKEPEIRNEIIEEIEEELPIPKTTIFDSVDSNDTYTTYHVYIVKENDNIENILEKFKITKEELSLYNKLEEVVKGTKLIIPSKNE